MLIKANKNQYEKLWTLPNNGFVWYERYVIEPTLSANFQDVILDKEMQSEYDVSLLRRSDKDAIEILLYCPVFAYSLLTNLIHFNNLFNNLW